MRLSTLSSPKALSALILALLSSAELAQARPDPKIYSKTEWSHNRGKKVARTAIRRALEKHSFNETIVSPGFNGVTPYETTAPYENVWGGLANEEAASVIAWLFAQPALNLTVSENATNWDNSMQVHC